MNELTNPEVLDALWEAATPEEREEIRRLLDDDLCHHIWRAQVGRQSEAADSLADEVGYGGAAGGGKTDLGAGLALTEHRRSAIFRREKAQTEGIIQRMIEIVGHAVGLNNQKGIWNLNDERAGQRLIEFAGLDNPLDHQRWQGRAHDLKYYDEVTEMREFQVRFTKGWNRTSDPSVRCRVLMGFNPPTTKEGEWVLDYFGPWLNDAHPFKADDGDLRFATTVGGKDMWVETLEPFVMFKGEPLYDFDPADFGPEKIITPKSRTFISSRTKDNYFYVRSGYIASLQALPEPLRSQMLEGDFKAGIEDDPWQVIPTSWIEQAQERWSPREEKGVMNSMGVDPVAGGRDVMPIYRRHGSWFDEPIHIPGHELPQDRAGPLAAARVVECRTDKAPVHADVIGWGLSMCNFLTANDIQTEMVNFSSKSIEKTADGKLDFFNMRAQVIWRMREALDPTNPHKTALPPNPKLAQDLASYKWELRPNGIYIMPKEQQKKLLGRSPDDGDACCLANMATMPFEVYEDIVTSSVEGDRYSDLN